MSLLGVLYFCDMSAMRSVDHPASLADTDELQFVGRETIDWVVNGLSTLLNWVFQYAKSAGKALPVP